MEKYSLTSDNSHGGLAKLTWSTYKDQLRIIVFTQIPNDPNHGRLSAILSPYMLISLFGALREIVLFEPTPEVPDITYRFANLRSTDCCQKQAFDAELCIGVGTDGVIWLSLVRPGFTRVKFKFQSRDAATEHFMDLIKLGDLLISRYVTEGDKN